MLFNDLAEVRGGGVQDNFDEISMFGLTDILSYEIYALF